MGRTTDRYEHTHSHEKSNSHEKSQQHSPLPLGSVRLDGCFTGTIGTPTHFLEVCVPVKHEVPFVSLEPALAAFLEATEAEGKHGQQNKPTRSKLRRLTKLHGKDAPIDPAKLWHDLIALCRTHQHHERRELCPEVVDQLSKKFSADAITEKLEHLEEMEDKLEQLQDVEAALEVDYQAKAERLEEVLDERDDLQRERDELEEQCDVLKAELEAFKNTHKEGDGRFFTGSLSRHFPVFKRATSDPDVQPPDLKPDLWRAKSAPFTPSSPVLEFGMKRRTSWTPAQNIVPVAADEAAGPPQDSQFLRVEGHLEARVHTQARVLSVDGPLQGRVPGQQLLDVVRGLSTGEAGVGEESSSGKHALMPHQADVWGQLSHALAADLDDVLPTRQAQDYEDLNARHRDHSMQFSSVTTQTFEVDKAGSYPKAFQHGLSVTTQTAFQHGLSVATQTDPMPIMADCLPPRSAPALMPQAQSERHPVGARLTALGKSTPSLWPTTPTTTCRGDTLQSISMPGPKVGPLGHVKTLAQHLEQQQAERTTLNSCTPRFSPRSTTAVSTAAKVATSYAKEVREDASEVPAKAGKGFSLGPDWPCSR